MTIAQEIRAYLERVNPEALYIGLEEEHDSALIGVTYIKREDEFVHIAMYQYELLVDSFSKEFEDSEDPEQDAVEWIDYNVANAYVGKYTPFIVYN